MTTVLSIDVVERVAAMHSTPQPTMTMRRWEGNDVPPADVQITISRTLPPHLLRHVLNTATERLCAPAEVPDVRAPYRRNAA